MLASLSIRDFVLIDRLDIDAAHGFTALTGQTGAGKSIILDALALALGGASDRAMIRTGQKQASVAAAFEIAPDHIVWETLSEKDIAASCDEALTLKRIVKASGPSRASINDQPVSAAVLQEIGELLVEIHGQHAASSLMRPASHRSLLDQYAGNQAKLDACAAAWHARSEAQRALSEQEAALKSSELQIAFLRTAVEDLLSLGPERGEADKLAAARTRLMQSERVTDTVSESISILNDGGVEDRVARAATSVDRINVLPGFAGSTEALPVAARKAAETLERALIELREASSELAALQHFVRHDGQALDQTESRLFSLRAAARKYNCDVDMLPDMLAKFQTELETAEAGDAALIAARKHLAKANAAWHAAADALTKTREGAAARLEKAIAKQLKPLKLGQATIRVALVELPEEKHSALGKDYIELEAQTNAGSEFGPLRKVASGGELARVSLALKCALAEAGAAPTLIFDEADQGVGGAVAAAIGERLTKLARKRQVFAVTHSPQVAASATTQWQIDKKRTGLTKMKGLDEAARREEIARMLSGAKITKEARAAAGRLLEDA